MQKLLSQSEIWDRTFYLKLPVDICQAAWASYFVHTLAIKAPFRFRRRWKVCWCWVLEQVQYNAAHMKAIVPSHGAYLQAEQPWLS